MENNSVLDLNQTPAVGGTPADQTTAAPGANKQAAPLVPPTVPQGQNPLEELLGALGNNPSQDVPGLTRDPPTLHLQPAADSNQATCDQADLTQTTRDQSNTANPQGSQGTTLAPGDGVEPATRNVQTDTQTTKVLLLQNAKKALDKGNKAKAESLLAAISELYPPTG
ncbi:hypothetical protein PCANC_08959 [Puccinia coronata f. sp. avenae]|uniref:Uncharacterized protein n=1 Tax=Puccinia coronata f. sp. avenae TaxID=200324 RepID=A0A2N5T2D4_9BASI|nr:hypothetical protein PCANC_08959 [Puccinia coronata f. sp. avenae]